MSTFSSCRFLSAFLFDDSFDELDFRLGKSEVRVKPLVVPRLRIVAHVGSQLRRLVHQETELREFRKMTLPEIKLLDTCIKVDKFNILCSSRT